MNRAQYDKLCQVAKHQNVVLMGAMWTRHLPPTLYLQQELLPKIGPVRHVCSEFPFPIWSPDMPMSSRFLNKQAGAGALLHEGVYALTWTDFGTQPWFQKCGYQSRLCDLDANQERRN